MGWGSCSFLHTAHGHMGGPFSAVEHCFGGACSALQENMGSPSPVSPLNMGYGWIWFKGPVWET